MKKLFLMLVCCTMVATANAQLGGLMKKAKKAAENVGVTVNTPQNNNTTANTPHQKAEVDPNDPNYIKSERAKTSWSREEDAVAAAGGMQKFLELETPDGQILWKYYTMEFADFDKRGYYRLANSYAKPLVEMLRFMKGNQRRNVPRDAKAFFDREQPTRLKDLKDKIMTKNDPMPDNELQALKRECARIRKMWEAIPEDQRINRMN